MSDAESQAMKDMRPSAGQAVRAETLSQEPKRPPAALEEHLTRLRDQGTQLSEVLELLRAMQRNLMPNHAAACTEDAETAKNKVEPTLMPMLFDQVSANTITISYIHEILKSFADVVGTRDL